jgi:hypothetical protein
MTNIVDFPMQQAWAKNLKPKFQIPNRVTVSVSLGCECLGQEQLLLSRPLLDEFIQFGRRLAGSSSERVAR